jgi:hypothetical protein
MPRFVLLYHECSPDCDRPSHWDLMLEVGEKLRTWAIPCLPDRWQVARARTEKAYPSCPATSNTTTVDATRLADHRIDYLHEEGLLSGNRGEVRRIDEGVYETIAENPRLWRVALSGGMLHGKITLHDSTISL